MTRPHKGDRVRLTLRLPRELVEDVDMFRRADTFREYSDRNDALYELIKLGLVLWDQMREGRGR